MIQIYGKVIKGDRYGRILGFPTANLDRRQYSRLRMKIKLGVWAGEVCIVGPASGRPFRRYRAGIVIGPIDNSGLPKIEAHLIGFKGSLYGKYISIYLNTYLRPFRKFKSEEGLKKQIGRDIAKIKGLKLING